MANTHTSKRIIAITKMTKKQLEEEFEKLELTFDSNLKVDEMKQILINRELMKEVKTETFEDNFNEKQLKKRAADILHTAAKHNAALQNLKTKEERQVYLDRLNGEIAPEVSEFILESFPDFNDAPVLKAGAVPISDLPASKILTNLPLRIVEQMIANVLVSYPLMNMVQKEMVTNGIKDIFYKDYRDVDNKSGFADVEIDDYNQGVEPTFKETYMVNTEIHKGYDIISSLLNDVTVTVGYFVALIKDFTMAVARPFAKKMYQRFITFLDTADSYDEVVTFTANDAKTKAKEVYNKLIELGTVSRSNLKKKPDGSAVALEYNLNTSNAHLVINKKYATDYKYDLAAGTFQLGEITLPVKSITVLDFDRLNEYTESNPVTNTLKGLDLILVEDGVYQEMIHYSANKQVNTTKLKEVFHRYDRIGNYRRKDKILVGFKPKAAA